MWNYVVDKGISIVQPSHDMKRYETGLGNRDPVLHHQQQSGRGIRELMHLLGKQGIRGDSLLVYSIIPFGFTTRRACIRSGPNSTITMAMTKINEGRLVRKIIGDPSPNCNDRRKLLSAIGPNITPKIKAIADHPYLIIKYPMAPNASTVKTSSQLFLRVNAPSMTNGIITGMISFVSIFAI